MPELVKQADAEEQLSDDETGNGLLGISHSHRHLLLQPWFWNRLGLISSRATVGVALTGRATCMSPRWSCARSSASSMLPNRFSSPISASISDRTRANIG